MVRVSGLALCRGLLELTAPVCLMLKLVARQRSLAMFPRFVDFPFHYGLQGNPFASF